MSLTRLSLSGQISRQVAQSTTPIGQPVRVLLTVAFDTRAKRTHLVAPQQPYSQQPYPPMPRYSYPGPSTGVPGKPSKRGIGAGVVVALSLVCGLLAGIVGGVVGYAVADSDASSDLDPSASLSTAPTEGLGRPSGSVARVAADVLPTVVSILVRSSGRGASGSGFIIRADGYILTNNHVIAGAEDGGEITVSFIDGTDAEAHIVGSTATYDLAVLKVDRTKLPTALLGDSDSLVVGDAVIAVGSPLGLSGTVTTGIVSALDRPVRTGDDTGDVSFISAVQTDAAINPGNSGGPLVDRRGTVVGINSSIATLSRTQLSGNIGLGFAIPINQARRIAEELIRFGVARYPIVGVNLDVSYGGPGAQILPADDGNRVPITPGGPADDAGLEPGDIITAVDGDSVDTYEEFVVAIRTRAPGDTVTLQVERGGDELSIDVTLGSTEG